MPSSSDPRETGSLPATNTPDNAPDQQHTGSLSAANRPDAKTSASSPEWIFAQPGTIPPNNQLPPQRPARRSPLNRRATWFILCGIVLLGIILGVIFAIPLGTDSQGKKTLAQTIGSAVAKPPATPVPSGPALTPGSYNSVTSRLFSNSSPWNLPIGTNVQLDPQSSNMVSQLGSCCHVPAMFNFGMPIYTSTASDPTYTVQDTGNDSLFISKQPIHIPDNAAPSPGSDHWMFIYDTTSNLIFEMWNTHKNGDTWTTQTGNVYSPTGDGVLQVDGSQQSGNGASYFGGVITDADIQRGYINHALSLATQYTSTSWRYPMNASDGQGTSANDLPMGARIQLDPSIDCNTLPGASVGEKMVCQALQTYGGYVRDTGGVTLSMYFEGENLNDPNRNPPDGSPGNAGRKGTVFNSVGLRDGDDLSAIPWDKMRVLRSWNSFTPLNTVSPTPPVAYTLPATRAAGPATMTDALHLPTMTGLAITENVGSKRGLLKA